MTIYKFDSQCKNCVNYIHVIRLTLANEQLIFRIIMYSDCYIVDAQ